MIRLREIFKIINLYHRVDVMQLSKLQHFVHLRTSSYVASHNRLARTNHLHVVEGHLLSCFWETDLKEHPSFAESIEERL